MNARGKSFNERNIAEFRATGGRIESFGEAPVLLLNTVGARTGKRRTNPLMYLADDSAPDRVYVFASAGGSDNNPDWFHNVVAHPTEITAEIGSEVFGAHADVVPEPKRTDIYAIQARRYPSFAAYEQRTKRRIPVVGLTLQR